jgi:outer membrane lipoprotein-sorting protein
LIGIIAMKLASGTLLLILSFYTTLGVCQLASSPGATVATAPPGKLTAEEIVSGMVERNLRRARALTAYQGTRVYHLEYRGFLSSKTADMVVDVKYRAPGKKEFSIRAESGSRLIIDRVFKRMLQTEEDAVTEENQNRIALNQENYRFTLADVESTIAGPSYVLLVEPRTDNKLLYRGRIWVNAEDFAVERMEVSPAKSPSFWTKETKIEQVYAKVGDFWLPAMNRSGSEIRLGGHANFTIDYRDYKITGAAPLTSIREVQEPNRLAPARNR